MADVRFIICAPYTKTEPALGFPVPVEPLDSLHLTKGIPAQQVIVAVVQNAELRQRAGQDYFNMLADRAAMLSIAEGAIASTHFSFPSMSGLQQAIRRN